jgi:hypothetical protein
MVSRTNSRVVIFMTIKVKNRINETEAARKMSKLTTESFVLLHWLKARTCGTHFIKDSFSKNVSASLLKIAIGTTHRTVDHDRAVTRAES